MSEPGGERPDDGPHAPAPSPGGLTAKIVEVFLTGNLSPLVIILSLIAGVFALLQTPREEEPQIVVPLADVHLEVPGASAAEIESLVAAKVEEILYQIDGVEYVYTHAAPHRAVVTVRFYVGEDREDALLAVHTRLRMHQDQIPPQVTGWQVVPVEVDDVPILFATLWSDRVSDYELRRLAEELEIVAKRVPDTGRTFVTGGAPRRLQVRFDAEALGGRGLTTDDVAGALQAAATSLPAGAFDDLGERTSVELRPGGHTPNDLGALVVGVHRGRPVRLDEVAEVEDGPAERTGIQRIGFGPKAEELPRHLQVEGLAARDFPAVTLAVAKRRGTNAVVVSERVQHALREAQAEFLPDDVYLRFTRDHGASADAKVEELLEGLLVAVIIVVALLAVALGMREALIVATAVPITFALTLLVNLLVGYSINRVTLFALMLALGLVVDDPIVDVENIHRHLGQRRGRSALRAVLDAVQEVRPPIILATMAVMVSFVPLFFITGMMGPYMAPMALNVPLAMLSSLLVAFTITPWMSYHVLKGAGHGGGDGTQGSGDGHGEEGSAVYAILHRVYGGIMRPVLRSRGLRYGLLLVTALLFGVAGWLALGRQVPLKMLPFDDKDELQVVVDMPEGTPLETTEAVVAELAAVVRGVDEVREVVTFTGEPSPIDFNGMVRGYMYRQLPHLGDLRINLVHKTERQAQSHALGIRLRQWLEPIAARHGAKLQIVEQPPGPPVIATLVVEVRGQAHTPYEELETAARMVAQRLAVEPGVCDVDTSVEDPSERLRFELDRTKAALHGVTERDVARALAAAVGGVEPAVFHAEHERQPLLAELRLPRPARRSVAQLGRLPIRGGVGAGGDGPGVVALSELGRFVRDEADRSIRHKNLQAVAYVFAEVAGRAPADVILDVQADRVPAGEPLPNADPRRVEERTFLRNGGGMPWQVPAGIDLAWNGEGEWKITLDAFRDLGLAFAAACLGIYVLLVHETKSYGIPLVLMLSIPFTVIGILPGFYLLNVLAAGDVGGVLDPVFFTATAMIGMIALSGIAVRNAILLIEFLRRALDEGATMEDAVVGAGGNRIWPIFLTAGTAMLAAVPITLDPIFSGLAWALIFGLVVSSVFTLVLVPMVYAMVVKAPVRVGPQASSSGS
jgi:multidrug efflux pump subunit AcrB